MKLQKNIFNTCNPSTKVLKTAEHLSLENSLRISAKTPIPFVNPSFCSKYIHQLTYHILHQISIISFTSTEQHTIRYRVSELVPSRLPRLLS